MRLIVLLFIAGSAFATDPYPKNENISVSHYVFRLELNDSTDVIAGEAAVTIRFLKPVASFDLNLIGKNGGATGMEVTSVKSSGNPVEYSFKNDLVTIKPTAAAEATFVISYKGIPADGLIISKNKFGDRTFFGDNWPDRGRHWLPAVDHPSYKSTVEFIVVAPSHYKVVATGKLVEEKSAGKDQMLTHYQEDVPVSVKVITIGVAKFAVQQSGMVGNIPVTTWVYPQNEADGFLDFSVAPKVLQFMQDYIGPYPFEKLAHVQSKTKFGGLENASNIFYFENSVNGKNEREELIAHETAHQWFGDSATEQDWHHAWLSEGFATYLAALYQEHVYGHDKLAEAMASKRKIVFEFAEKNNAPIVDTTIVDLNKLLSPNTYQKAAWVLHMLRKEMGDDDFHAGIREYYDKYKGKTALTADFVAVMQRHSISDLKPFFKRWLYRGGYPKISGKWTYMPDEKMLALTLNTQSRPYQPIPVELKIETTKGSEIITIQVMPEMMNFQIPCKARVKNVVADPGTWLLADIQIVPR